jgi:ketosteroid isomerase-like protein
MSREDVEVLRAVYASVEARGIEGLLGLATEDVVWISDPTFPGGGIHRGKESVQRWLGDLWIYDEVSIEIEEIIGLDGGALGITRWHAVSHDGPRVDWLWCHLVSVRDGLIYQAQSFLDKESALEAARRPKPPA